MKDLTNNQENKTTFKRGDKFILEIGERDIYDYKIVGTDLWIKTNLLEKLILVTCCDKCKYYEEAEKGYEYCHKWQRETQSDWFCSRGNDCENWS